LVLTGELVADSEKMAERVSFEYPTSVLEEPSRVPMAKRSLNERYIDVLRVCIHPIKATPAFTQSNLCHRNFKKMSTHLAYRGLLRKYKDGSWVLFHTTPRGRQVISLYTRLDYILNSPEMKKAD
jgi:predicted transcriptional regulator